MSCIQGMALDGDGLSSLFTLLRNEDSRDALEYEEDLLLSFFNGKLGKGILIEVVANIDMFPRAF